MKRFQRFLANWIFLFILFLPTIVTAFPDHDGYVTDRGGMLKAADRATLEALLRAYEQRTTNEVAVLIVSSLDGMDDTEYANKVFHQWGIGKKGKDNGVLFLWSTGDRKIRLEVGYGLESLLPDGRAGQIIRENITPAFRQQRWKDGVFAGVNAITAQLDRQALPEPTPVAVADPNLVGSWRSIAPVIVVASFIMFGLGLVIFLMRREKYKPFYEPSIGAHEDRAVAVKRVTTAHHRSQVAAARTHSYRSGVTYIPIPSEAYEPSRRSDDSPSSYSSSSSDSSSDSGSSFGGFGGGDSGGGGASGSY